MDELDLVRRFGAAPPMPSNAAADARCRLDAAMTRSRRRASRPWAIASGVVAATAVLAAFVVLRTEDAPAARRTVYTDALLEFPQDTAADVVAHANSVVLATALTATELPDTAPPARAAAGEGSVNRIITFRVDEVLWQRPGATTPVTFESVWWGWSVQARERTTMVARGAAWVEVGGQYVVPLGTKDGRPAPTLPLAVFPYVDGMVAPAEGQDSPLAQQLTGATRTVVGQVFSAAVRP